MKHGQAPARPRRFQLALSVANRCGHTAVIHRLVILSAGLLLASPTVSFADQPNVLMIVIDDLNDWIGCLGGHPQSQTPNIDRLAARGLLFTNAHCAATACNPSRAAVFSGLMPKVTGVWSNQSGSIQRNYPSAKLLPTMFRESGYLTLGTGKLLHSGGKDLYDQYYATEQRWSPLTREAVRYTDEELPSKQSDNPRHVTTDSQGRQVVLPLNRMPSARKPNRNDGESFDWGPFDVPDTDFGDTKITNWAIEQLSKQRDTPMFLAVGYYRPHIPLWAPQRYFDRFAHTPGKLPAYLPNDLDDLSEVAKEWAIAPITAGRHAAVIEHQQWQAAVEAYLACVTYVDHEVGRLLDALDESAINRETLIVLWSDHGWHLGEKQHWGKWTGWERSTRVPLLVVPPANVAHSFAPAGSHCDQPVGLIDLYPTLAELCDLTTPGNLFGKSLVPLLREPQAETNRVVTTTFDTGNVSLRSSRYRYLRYRDGSEELYDLVQDPNEWHNLADASEHLADLERFRRVLDR